MIKVSKVRVSFRSETNLDRFNVSSSKLIYGKIISAGTERVWSLYLRSDLRRPVVKFPHSGIKSPLGTSTTHTCESSTWDKLM